MSAPAGGHDTADLLARVGVVAFDHVALGVQSIDVALRVYRDLLGGVVEKSGTAHHMGFNWLQLRYPNRSKLELLEPVNPADAANFLVRFLARRGEGVHHLTYYVASLDQAMAAARAAGLRVVGESRRHPEWQEAFVLPADAHGTVIQFAQTDPSEWYPPGSPVPGG